MQSTLFGQVFFETVIYRYNFPGLITGKSCVSAPLAVCVLQHTSHKSEGGARKIGQTV